MSTRHQVSASDPTYVVGADAYRVAHTLLLTPDRPDFAELEEALRELGETGPADPEGYGVALLESEEHAVTYLGPVDQVARYQRSGGAAELDRTHGRSFPFWPHGWAWEQEIPFTTWNAGGQGIVSALPHHDTTVVIYECFERHYGQGTPVVAFHCLRCHNDNWGDRTYNLGPGNRRRIGAEARRHIHDDSACVPLPQLLADGLTPTLQTSASVTGLVAAYETQCAADGPCAQLRALRAPTR